MVKVRKSRLRTNVKCPASRAAQESKSAGEGGAHRRARGLHLLPLAWPVGSPAAPTKSIGEPDQAIGGLPVLWKSYSDGPCFRCLCGREPIPWAGFWIWSPPTVSLHPPR